MKLKIFWIVIVAIAFFILYVLWSAQPQISSSATSTVQSVPQVGGGVSTKAGASTTSPPYSEPSNKTSSVSCNLSGNVIKLGNGKSQVDFTWNSTPGTLGWINSSTKGPQNNEVGYIENSTSTTGTITSPEFNAPTTFTMVVTSGIATSTCSFLATPQ